MRRFRSLGARLFLSHFLVVLVGLFTLLAAVLVIAPLIFGSLMGGMMEQIDGMMSGMGDMMGSVSRAFGRTILYSLLIAGIAATAAAAGASLFVSRRITRPVEPMLSAAGRESRRHGPRRTRSGGRKWSRTDEDRKELREWHTKRRA